MDNKSTQFNKKFAWLPVKARTNQGKQIHIWFKTFYEKKVWFEGPLITGWMIFRSLKPFPTRNHLKVIK